MIWWVALLMGCFSKGDSAALSTNGPSPLGDFGEPYCEMTEVGRLTLDGDYKTAITGDDRYLYVAAGDAGVAVLDASDPSAPRQTGFFSDFDGYDAHRLMLHGDLLSVAHLWAGWYLLDVSGGGQPTKVSRTVVEHPDPDATWGLPVTDVWFDDQYAYVAGTHLLIYDISDPANPALLGEVPPEWDDSVPDELRLHTTTTVHVRGNYAFLTEADDTHGRLVVVDISDKTNPTVVAWVDGPGDLYQLEVVGDIAYVADLEFGVRAFDISDPLNPRLLDTIRTSGQSYSLFAYGDRLYVADNLNGLMGIDVSDPFDLAWTSYRYVGGKPGRVGLQIGDGDGPWGAFARDGMVAMITTGDLVTLEDCTPAR